MLLGTGVQVHASLLKHHLRMGTSEGRGPSARPHPRGGALKGVDLGSAIYPQGRGPGSYYLELGTRSGEPRIPACNQGVQGWKKGRGWGRLYFKKVGAQKSKPAAEKAGPEWVFPRAVEGRAPGRLSENGTFAKDQPGSQSPGTA